MPGKSHWSPGDPLTDADQILLSGLIAKAEELGYTPTFSETPNSKAIKARFRTWGRAVKAAGLPWLNYPEQQRLRQQRCRQVTSQAQENELISSTDSTTRPFSVAQ